MCDYSLMTITNRLAVVGEKLIVHKFYTGSLGLTSASALAANEKRMSNQSRGFWSVLEIFFDSSRRDRTPAVCVPPGARLMLQDISPGLQRDLRVQASEEVTFTQLTAAMNSYRDAVRFGNGKEVLLQRLHEGQRVTVLSLSLREELAPANEERSESKVS